MSPLKSSVAHFEGDNTQCPLRGARMCTILDPYSNCRVSEDGSRELSKLKTAHNQMLFNKFLLKGPRTWVKQIQLFKTW